MRGSRSPSRSLTLQQRFSRVVAVLEHATLAAVKYVPSAFAGQLSRSLGSTTASRNRYGSYFRNRTTPVNPSTGAQETVRARLAGFSAQWSLLSDTQRAGWTALGLQMVRSDSLGQQYNLTGLQAYTSVNASRFLVGLSTQSDAPLLGSPTALTSITLTGNSA